MSWYNEDKDIAGNYLSCKEGELLKVKVKEIKKVVGDTYSKFNYKRKTGEPLLTSDTHQPFHHELISEDGKTLTIGSLSLMAVLRDAKVEAGEAIEIGHPGRGKYEVRRLSEAEQVF